MAIPNIEHRRSAVIAQIRDAFADISREGGVSLHEADVIDMYGTDAQREAARLRDTDRHWWEVPDSDIDTGYWVLNFLDPIRFRYYIPAYMIWTLKYHATTDSLSADHTVYTFDHSSDARYALLNAKQSAAICAFLRYMVEAEEAAMDEVDLMMRDAAAAEALTHWDRFC